MIPLLEFQHVSVMRGRRTVLEDLTLAIQPNERVALLGPNGCGKSTFIKTICRDLYPVVKPKVFLRLLGQTFWDVSELRKHLGIVSTDLLKRFHGDETVQEVVLSGFFSHIGLAPHDRIEPQMIQRADDLLSELEIDHLKSRFFGELSSGEAQRVLIARALVLDPESLLFDEPTNSLDIGARHELLATMRKLTNRGHGLILVTHQLSDIIPEIDRVILMKDGHLIADGPKHSILKPERLEALFNRPIRMVEDNGFFHAWPKNG